MAPIIVEKDDYKPTDIKYHIDTDKCKCGALLKSSADLSFRNGIVKAYCKSCGRQLE